MQYKPDKTNDKKNFYKNVFKTFVGTSNEAGTS